jgi:hypothetical protein
MLYDKTRYDGSHYSFSHSTIHSLFPTDTEDTLSLLQWNWWSRSRTYGQCSTTKSGSMARTTRFLIQPLIHYLPQTLTTLNLSRNQIGDQGAEHMAIALRQNQVARLALIVFSFNHSVIISHRH